MRTEIITIAGFELECTIDAGERWVSVPDIERLLKWRADQGREKLASKSLKAFAGKRLNLGKKLANRVNGRPLELNMVTTEDFSLLVIWEATRGNAIAAGLVVATMAEAVNRRIDDVFAVEKTNYQYDTEAKKTFDTWVAMRESHGLVYEGFMNSGGSPLIADKLMRAYYGLNCATYKREFERIMDAKADFCPDHSTLARMREIIDLRRNFTRTSKRHSTTERIRLAVAATQRKYK